MPGTAAGRSRFHGQALGIALVVLLLSGCSGGAAAQLVDPMEEALAALQSEQLALQLLDEQRLTKSVTSIVFEDMTDELTGAEKAIHSAGVSNSDDEALRDTALAAARDATSASLAGRDCLTQNQSCADEMTRLKSAAQGIQAVLDQLQGS
jgi:hypothetical protein